MGAPLPPQPAVGCKTAAGKSLGSSSAVASQPLHGTGHHEQGQLPVVGSGFTVQGMHCGFSYPACPGDGNFTVISSSCLSEAQNGLLRGCVHRHEHWATSWRKRRENGMSGSSLLAMVAVNCLSSTCLPLSLSFQLVGFTLFRSLFLILAPSLSPSLGIFFQMQSMYISFFLHNVFLPPWQYFSCSNLLSSCKDINPILLNPAS